MFAYGVPCDVTNTLVWFNSWFETFVIRVAVYSFIVGLVALTLFPIIELVFRIIFMPLAALIRAIKGIF